MAGAVEYDGQTAEVEELDAQEEIEAGGSGRSQGAGQRRLVQVFVKHKAAELAQGGVIAGRLDDASLEPKQQLSVGTTMYLDDVATAEVI